MRGITSGGLAALMILGMALPASAQMTADACSKPVTSSGEFAPWNNPQPVQAAATRSQLATATIVVGQAAQVTLVATPTIAYPLRPEKPGGSVSYGGLLSLAVPTPGNYRIALGSGAWIDLVSDGKAMISTAHSHGPACTGIHKMVDFALAPGHYTLEIAANGELQTRVLVLRLP